MDWNFRNLLIHKDKRLSHPLLRFGRKTQSLLIYTIELLIRRIAFKHQYLSALDFPYLIGMVVKAHLTVPSDSAKAKNSAIHRVVGLIDEEQAHVSHIVNTTLWEY